MLSITYEHAGLGPTSLILDPWATPTGQTAAIQGVLNLVAGAGGGHVLLSAGTFTLAGTGNAADGCLRIGSNTTLEGAGMGATTLRLADGSGSVTGIVRTASGGTPVTTSHVTVANLSIDGNRAATTGSVDGFYSGPKPDTGAYDTDIRLDHVEIYGVSRYGFDPHEGTRQLVITHCVSHDNGADGFTIDGSSDVTIVDSEAYGNGRHGFNIVTGSADVELLANQAYGNSGAGLVIQTGDNEVRAWTAGVVVSGGRYDDNSRAGIEVRQASDVTISGVVAARNAMEGILLQGVEGAQLDGNVLSDNGSTLPPGAAGVRISGYLQDFGDTDPLNDRWIVSSGVVVDGVALGDTEVPAGYSPYTFRITAGDDIVTGSLGRDRISAGLGNDRVSGAAGNDELFGGAGDDMLYGDDGNDRLEGGIGNDSVVGGAGADLMVFAHDFDKMDGGAGTDTADFQAMKTAIYANMAASPSEVWTSSASTATAANATVRIADLVATENLLATAYNDTIFGNGAANRLDGVRGNDILKGNGGVDILIGGKGNDTLTGGAATDRYQFATDWGLDTITDLLDGKEKIAFDHVAGLTGFSQLSVANTAGGARISFDGDTITLAGIAASQITAADVLFL